ncbi:SCO5918 family protein [Streptomyces caeni]|uniref:SCO5918 family protein n=1 Tax=Streptomyces caeni TaxID=2307231 RepID=A0ABW4IWV8_9ACTN
MRCVIARYPFELTKTGVLASMAGVKPEPVTGESVTIGRRRYPVKQVGAVVTGQDRRDFTSGEVVRAMIRLGFTCHSRPEAAPVSAAPRQPAAPEPFGRPGPGLLGASAGDEGTVDDVGR